MWDNSLFLDKFVNVHSSDRTQSKAYKTLMLSEVIKLLGRGKCCICMLSLNSWAYVDRSACMLALALSSQARWRSESLQRLWNGSTKDILIPDPSRALLLRRTDEEPRKDQMTCSLLPRNKIVTTYVDFENFNDLCAFCSVWYFWDDSQRWNDWIIVIKHKWSGASWCLIS